MVRASGSDWRAAGVAAAGEFNGFAVVVVNAGACRPPATGEGCGRAAGGAGTGVRTGVVNNGAVQPRAPRRAGATGSGTGFGVTGCATGSGVTALATGSGVNAFATGAGAKAGFAGVTGSSTEGAGGVTAAGVGFAETDRPLEGSAVPAANRIHSARASTSAPEALRCCFAATRA